MQLIYKLFAAMTVLCLATGGVIAQTSPYGQERLYGQDQTYGQEPPLPNPRQDWIPEGRSMPDAAIQEWDGFRYDYSGTRGRMGFGGDPAYPEGPDDFASPGR